MTLISKKFIATPPSTKPPLLFSFGVGMGVMGATAPAIHPCNVASAVAASENVSSRGAIRRSYQGLGNLPKGRVLNLWSGFGSHILKESIRSGGKISGLVYADPFYRRYMHQTAATHAFAATMSTFEVVVANPVDVYKARRAVGLPFQLRAAYQGALFNGARQYATWGLWRGSTNMLRPRLRDLGIDPDSLSGLALMAIPQSAAFTSVAYPFELTLRRMQLRPENYQMRSAIDTFRYINAVGRGKASPTHSTYYQAVRDIYRTEGVRGFYKGVAVKGAGNAVLAFGATGLPLFIKYLSELGSEKE